MLRIAMVVYVAVLGLAGSAGASVWYVDGSSAGAEDGLSWATAFRTIQAGIDAATVASGATFG